MGLLRFSISSWSSFGKLYFSKNLSILPHCPFYWHIIVDNTLLWSFVFLCCLLWSLHFHPAILLPVCALSNLALCMIYPAWKLNKQGDNIQPWHNPFPIWNQSVIPCLVLTAVSWPANNFLRRQERWSDIPISWRIFQFVVIHRVKGFDVVNKAEVDVFSGTLLLFLWSNWCWQFDLWFLCLF